MAIPDFQSLMLPVLRLAAAGETRVPDAADAIANELGLSEAERGEVLPSGRNLRLRNRIHWAKFYMTKAGLIETPTRGRFVASEAGRALLRTNPAGINVEALKQYPAFIEFYSKNEMRPSTDGQDADPSADVAAARSTPEEQIDAAQAVMQAALKTELLQRILGQSPAFFEGAIVDLLVAMGYGGTHEDAARRLGRTGDGGIDGVIDEDRLGLDRIYVQAKRYAEHVAVGRPEIQGFVGSLVGVGAAKGVFVTTSKFTAGAVEFAGRLPQRVVLIDGDALAELMIEHGVGVRLSRTVEIKRIDEDFFLEE